MTLAIPRIVIAGTHSGCGKTTIARGLMAALHEQGLRVQPFKTGPDFIDPSHHAQVCGRISRNLDPFMMGSQGILRTFASAATGADIAVIEGAMGLFDGIGGTDRASTAHVARILRAPVILAADASATTRSIHALIKGFSGFDPRIEIQGIIFNRIATPAHRRMIEDLEIIPAFGWVPYDPESEMKSRHLGLVMADETKRTESCGRIIRDSCDTGQILTAARRAPPLPLPAQKHGAAIHDRVTIGIARDSAFCFYYQDNLDRLIRAGADLRFFSPLENTLPEADALYFGGGYPELHARALSRSRCRDAVRRLADDGMPIYGECGGLMYLCETTECDRTYRMAGVLPARTLMTGKIQALGYVSGSFARPEAPWAGNLAVTGHEFHFSRVECNPDARFALRLEQGTGIHDGLDGITVGSTIGSYTHAYFTDAFCRSFVEAAREYGRRG